TDKSNNTDDVQLGYDKDFLLTSIGDLSFERNDFGAIASSQLGTLEQTIEYNEFGEMVSDSYGFDHEHQHKHKHKHRHHHKFLRGKHSHHRHHKHKHHKHHKDIYNLELSRDLLGRIESVKENGTLIRYKYDTLGRLTKVDRKGRGDTIYKYDEN